MNNKSVRGYLSDKERELLQEILNGWHDSTFKNKSVHKARIKDKMASLHRDFIQFIDDCELLIRYAAGEGFKWDDMDDECLRKLLTIKTIATFDKLTHEDKEIRLRYTVPLSDYIRKHEDKNLHFLKQELIKVHGEILDTTFGLPIFIGKDTTETLTPHQEKVLNYIKGLALRRECVTSNRLSIKLKWASAYVTKILNQLVDKGLLRKDFKEEIRKGKRQAVPMYYIK